MVETIQTQVTLRQRRAIRKRQKIARSWEWISRFGLIGAMALPLTALASVGDCSKAYIAAREAQIAANKPEAFPLGTTTVERHGNNYEVTAVDTDVDGSKTRVRQFYAPDSQGGYTVTEKKYLPDGSKTSRIFHSELPPLSTRTIAERNERRAAEKIMFAHFQKKHGLSTEELDSARDEVAKNNPSLLPRERELAAHYLVLIRSPESLESLKKAIRLYGKERDAVRSEVLGIVVNYDTIVDETAEKYSDVVGALNFLRQNGFEQEAKVKADGFMRELDATVFARP